MTGGNHVSMMRMLMCLLLFLVLDPCPLVAAANNEDGRESFLFESWGGPALQIFVTRPPGLSADQPVIFVMHGMSRTAELYRDQWHALALHHEFLLVVPEFSEENFPKSRNYNLGNVFTRDGQPTPASSWSFSAVEKLFDAIRDRYQMTAPTYALYGHSAGGQFVHRFLMYLPNARVSRAVVANAGWYTLPDFGIEYPYGLKNSRVDAAGLGNALQLPLTILLGDRDTDPNSENLRQSTEAKAQGPNRLARGFYYFESARLAAEQLSVPFNWHLSTVRGAGHDNALMAPEAIRYLLPE